jgi:hypothetical protein
VDDQADSAWRHRDTAALENKLDDLAAQLAALTRQQQARGSSLASDPASIASPSHSRPSFVPGSTTSVLNVAASPYDAVSIVPAPGYAVSGISPDDPINRGLITERDAAASLTLFRTSYTPHCPFVALHPAHTLATVRRDLPTTFLAMIALTESRPTIRRSLQDALRQRLFSGIIQDGEASLDLLRSLLIYAAWHQHFRYRQRTPRVFLMLQLCQTLVHELQLEKNVDETFGSREEQAGDRERVEKRLLLGVFWFSVGFARSFALESFYVPDGPR